MKRATGRIGNMLFSIIHNLIYIIEEIKNKKYDKYKYIFLYFDTKIFCLYTNGSNKQLIEYLTLLNCDLLLNKLILDNIIKPIYYDDFYPYYIIYSVLDIEICNKLNSYLVDLYKDLRKKEQIEDDKEYITISLHYRLSDFCATGFSKCYNHKQLTYEGSNFRILSFIYYRDCLKKIFDKEKDKNFKIIIYYLSSPLDDLFIKFFIEYLKISFDDLKEKIKFITEIDYLDELTDKTKIFDLSIIYSASLSNYLILSNSTFGFWMFYFKLLKLKLDDLPIPVIITNVYFGNYFIYYTDSSKYKMSLLHILNDQYFLWLQPDNLIKVMTTTDKTVNLPKYFIDDINLYNQKIQFESSCIVDSAYFICLINDIIRTTLILIYIYLYIDNIDNELDLVDIIKILYCLDFKYEIGQNQQFYFDIFKFYILDQKELIKERIVFMFQNFEITTKNKDIFDISHFFNLLKTNIDKLSIKEYIELCTYKNTDIDKFNNFIYLKNDYIFEIKIDKPTDEFKNFIRKFINNNEFLNEFPLKIDIFKYLLNNNLFLLICKFWYISNIQKLSELKNIFDSKDTTKYEQIHTYIKKLYIEIYGENNQKFKIDFDKMKKLLYGSDKIYEQSLDNIILKIYTYENPTLQILIFIKQQIS